MILREINNGVYFILNHDPILYKGKCMLLEKSLNAYYDLSIVMPCFMEYHKLINTLKSIKKAIETPIVSHLKIEVIIIDNNSPISERLSKIIKKYRDVLNISFFMQPKLISTFSLASARNRGVLMSRGDWIFFTDADCMIDTNFFVEFDKIKNNERDRLYTGERVFVAVDKSLNENRINEKFFEKLERCPSASNYGLIKDRRFPQITNLPNQEHPWNFVHGCFMLFAKENYLKVNGSDTAYDGHWGYEEIDLVYRMVKDLGIKVHYIQDAKVYHQEFPEDILKISNNKQRTNKKDNPNYVRICEKIEGYDDYKKRQFKNLDIETE